MTLVLKDIEVKFRRFVAAQTSVFAHHKYLVDWCKDSIEGVNDQASYELARNIFSDVVSFERAFDSFEVEFWNYIENVDDARDRIDSECISLGFADQKEYFFSKIESCVSVLSDVVTEVKASGFEWPFLDELADSLEALFDVTEDLIEVDIKSLSNDEILALLQKIPPQRIAPIELVASGNTFRRKLDTRAETRISEKDIRSAISALRDVLSETYQEIQGSNCDPRVSKLIARCLSEVNKEFELFSPIQFGIHVGVANQFRAVVKDELGIFLAQQYIATLMQCDLFLQNFKSWSSYVRREEESDVSGGAELIDVFSPVVSEDLFDADIIDAISDLKTDSRSYAESRKIDYSIFQSVSNIISEVCRHGLRVLGLVTRSVGAFVADVGRDGMKKSLQVLAYIWLVRHANLLSEIAEKFPFFGWLRPVIEFLKSHAGT